MYMLIGAIISIWYWLIRKLQPDPGYCPLPTTNKDCLIVYLHGLNGSPTRARPYLSKIRVPATILTPIIPYRGNCSLEVAAESIITYIEQNNYKTIILIGYSNGARIASYIENTLPYNVNVLFISIAGVHYGSKLMNIIDYLGLCNLFGVNRKVVENLKWHKSIVLPNRQHTTSYYISASMDERVFPFVKLENQHIINWCSHTSVLEPAMEYAIDIIHKHYL